VTSVRRDDRAPRGFSSYLRALGTTGARGGSAGPGADSRRLRWAAREWFRRSTLPKRRGPAGGA
jgi:hypothetical protein